MLHGIKRTAATLLLTFAASQAHAIDREALYMMQITLNEHGFDAGKPDGRMGAKTRAAIAAFTEKYGGSTDPDELILHMVRLSYEKFQPIEDEETLEKIRVGVGKELKDPQSAQIRRVKRVTGPDKTTFICGEVNGKNSYGAYAGFVPFMSTGDVMSLGSYELMTYETIPYMIENETSFVFWRCELAFPRK